MTGAEALANFRRADKLIQDGKLEEARAMKDQLLSTDWSIIERRIEAANANGSHDQ